MAALVLLIVSVLCAGCDCGLGSQVCASTFNSERSTLLPGAARRLELSITSEQAPGTELRSQSILIGAETDAAVGQLVMQLFDEQVALVDEETITTSAEDMAVVIERDIDSLEGRFSFFVEVSAPEIQAYETVEMSAFLQYCEETGNSSEARVVELRFCPDAC